MKDLELLSAKLRYKVIEMSFSAKTAHLGSSLSIIDIITVLYENILNLNASNFEDDNRDRFILSKGHAATALYAILNHKKIISNDELKNYSLKDSLLEEHPSPKLNGVEAATGSLGHGLAIGNGIALAAKIKKKLFRTYVLMSDGEINEGSVWEAAFFSSRYKLNNLTAIIDFNKWQATGRSEDVLSIGPLYDKWKSFGWNVKEIDGHNHDEINTSLNNNSTNYPHVIIAHTVKGKGVSFMEDDNNWHYRSPNEEELIVAKKELGI